ncbi:MAG: FIG003437: hypothetical with DnaJ-like domain, partial [uncultured Sphingomonas sp.]
ARLRPGRRVQGAAERQQLRRAGRVAVAMPRPCPRAQREVQLLRRHEHGGDRGGAVAGRRLGPGDPRLCAWRCRPRSALERLPRPAGRDRRTLRGAVQRRRGAAEPLLGGREAGARSPRAGAGHRPARGAQALFGAGPPLPPRPQRRRPQPGVEAALGDRRLAGAQGRPGVRL